MNIEDLKIFKLAGFSNLIKGYNYFINSCILSSEKLDDIHTKFFVKGSHRNIYEVIIDEEKPRKSTCNCSYCSEHPMRFCKHKVAAYLSLHLDEFEILREEIDTQQLNEEKRRAELEAEIKSVYINGRKKALEKINKMNDEQIKEQLVGYLIDEDIGSKIQSLYNELNGWDNDPVDDFYENEEQYYVDDDD